MLLNLSHCFFYRNLERKQGKMGKHRISSKIWKYLGYNTHAVYLRKKKKLQLDEEILVPF